MAASQAAVLHYRSLRSRRRTGSLGCSHHSSGPTGGHDGHGREDSWRPSARRLRKVLFQDLDQEPSFPQDENAEPAPVSGTRTDRSPQPSSQFGSQKLGRASSCGAGTATAASRQSSARAPLLPVQRSSRDESASKPLVPPAPATSVPVAASAGWDATAEAEPLFADDWPFEELAARLPEEPDTVGTHQTSAALAWNSAPTTAVGSGGPEARAGQRKSASGMREGLAQAVVMTNYF